MTNGPNSPFSATGSLLGYLYQVRYALLAALQAHPVSSAFLISVELLDDVAFEPLAPLGDPAVLFQTKHHVNRTAVIGDASPDLWRTIRVWAELIKSGQFIVGSVLNLITTATAPPRSITAHLRPGVGRDVGDALIKMEEVSHTSTNEANRAAYGAFLALDAGQRRRLLDAITVLDGRPSIGDIEGELRKQVHWAAQGQHHDPFLQRLEGWWYRRVIRQLTIGGDKILSVEVEAQMDELRESFKRDALPIDGDIVALELDDGTRAAHQSSTFVRQLELIKATQGRITAAIREYYRAFEQRSRWVRDDLLLVGELDSYEVQLVDEWNLCFERIRNELGADAAEDAKCEAARQVLSWAETTIIPLRTVNTPFVTRGSLHMLADEVRIGWHPEFRDRLASLLAGASA